MKKILIANRGEIAVRIIRTAQEMGIATVAIHSKCDAEALHVLMADESVCIGENRAKDSYLNIASIMSAVDLTGADALHPGYGFLSEKADFAEVVEKCGINYIGPKSTTIKSMGSKVESREIVEKADVPVLSGTGVLEDEKEARQKAKEIGFPILLKASHGGGGRGMRIVWKEEEIEETFHSARSESQTAFGSPDIFLEKFIPKPRHIEIQVMADKHGNVVYFGERECSLQRRHQKVIEEAPSPVLSEDLRKRMGEAACRVAKEVDYIGAGTVEFLLDDNNDFYFMEMNTRIQVEHPVTEMIFDVDLIRLQIEVADGAKLPFSQSDLKFKGHSIECRVNAEDPTSFIPCPGPLEKLILAGGAHIRNEFGTYQGAKVTPFYDSMIGKLVVWGRDRDEAIIRMKRALRECQIDGIRTNLPLQRAMIAHPDFAKADFYTKWIEEKFLPEMSDKL